MSILPPDNPANGVPVCTLLRVPPSALLLPLEDLRDRTGAAYKEFFERLVADIREHGVRVPLICYREELCRQGDRLRVGDGETRRLASLLTAVKDLPVLAYDRPLSKSEMKLAQMQCNALRQDMTDLEYARVYFQLMQENGWGQTELARRINHKTALICKRLAVLRGYPEDLHHLIGEGNGKVPFTTAYLLSRLGDEPKIRELTQKVVQGDLSRDGAEVEVSALLNGNKPAKAKSIKVDLGGITLIITVDDLEQVFALLAQLDVALKKIEKHGLPLSSLPALLNGS